MNIGLFLLVSGIMLMTLIEELPRWLKTAIWVVMVVLGVILGGLKVVSI